MAKNAQQFEMRPWGSFEILGEFKLENGQEVVVKKIIIEPTKRLSYQSHNFRTEHWVIVQGLGKVTLDGEETDVKAGDKIDVAPSVKHRLANTDNALPLISIEVSTGQFDEFDEYRYEDDYGRSSPTG